MPLSAPREQRWPGPGAKVGGGWGRNWWRRFLLTGEGRDRILGCIIAPPTERCCPSTWHGGGPRDGSTLRKRALPPLTAITTCAQCQAQGCEQSTWRGLQSPTMSSCPRNPPPLCLAPHLNLLGDYIQMKGTPLSALSTIRIFLLHLSSDHVQQLLFYPHCLQMKNWTLRKVKIFPHSGKWHSWEGDPDCAQPVLSATLLWLI